MKQKKYKLSKRQEIVLNMIVLPIFMWGMFLWLIYTMYDVCFYYSAVFIHPKLMCSLPFLIFVVAGILTMIPIYYIQLGRKK